MTIYFLPSKISISEQKCKFPGTHFFASRQVFINFCKFMEGWGRAGSTQNFVLFRSVVVGNSHKFCISRVSIFHISAGPRLFLPLYSREAWRQTKNANPPFRGRDLPNGPSLLLYRHAILWHPRICGTPHTANNYFCGTLCTPIF